LKGFFYMILVSPSVPFPIQSLLLPSDAGNLCDVAWSPQGTHLAAVTSAGWVFVWDIGTGELLHQKQITRVPLFSVAWARQGCFLAIGCQKGILRMLDAQLAVRAVYPCSSPVTRIAWAPHVVGACVIVAGQNVIILREEAQTTRAFTYQNVVLDAAWSDDGRQVAILCANGLVEIWHARTFRLIHRFYTEPMTGGALLWDQACRRVAVVENAGILPSSPASRSLFSGTGGRGCPTRDPTGRYLASPGPHAVLLYPAASPG
jgi:WD40 repeat protein